MMRSAVEGELDRTTRRGSYVRVLHACGCSVVEWVRGTGEAGMVAQVQAMAAEECRVCRAIRAELEAAERRAAMTGEEQATGRATLWDARD